MKIKFFILGLFFSSFVLLISTSCQKKTDCKLIITTIDSAGNPLPLADVKLFANVKPYGIAVPDVKGNTQVSIGESVVKLKHNKIMKKS